MSPPNGRQGAAVAGIRRGGLGPIGVQNAAAEVGRSQLVLRLQSVQEAERCLLDRSRYIVKIRDAPWNEGAPISKVEGRQ